MRTAILFLAASCFVVSGAEIIGTAQLSTFARINGASAPYHITEAPNGQFAVADYGSSQIFLVDAGGGNSQRFGTPLIQPTSVGFFSMDVGFSTCNPAPLASRAFCFSGASNCPRGVEGVAPGNQSGVSLPRYLLNTNGRITSTTFYLTNGGTGEVFFIDPVSRGQRRVANGFSISNGGGSSRGPEQMALNVNTNHLYVVDAGRNSLVDVDPQSGQQRALRSDFNWPFGVALMRDGNLLVSNRGDGMLILISPDGTLLGHYDTGLGANALRGLQLSVAGDILLVSDSKQTIYRVSLVAGPAAPAVVTTVHAATLAGSQVAQNSIASAFGADLANATLSAPDLPTTLGGVTVTITDRNSLALAARLFFVSSGQVNYLVPGGLAAGPATLSVKRADASTATGTLTIAPFAPGLFSANADGKGVPAAGIVRARGDGSRSNEDVARFDTDAKRFVAIPIDLGPATDQVVLILYGTGIRGDGSTRPQVTATIKGTPLTVLYAGAQGQFEGLDQVNLLLSRDAIGAGETELRLMVNGAVANVLQVTFK